jgi:gliding motility-associated-like protein
MSKIYLIIFSALFVFSSFFRANAQQTLQPFGCPVMAGIVNEGPSVPDKPSYLSLINSQTGEFGGLVEIEDTLSGLPMLSLNGFGILSNTGMGYAQYQRVPSREEVLAALLLSGNYISTSTLVQVGSNAKAVNLGTLTSPVSSGYNLHGVIGLLGTADNSGNYIIAAGEIQYNALTQVADSFKLYIGRVQAPDTTVQWSEVTLDASCTVFKDAFVNAIMSGADAGPQDMVWSPRTGELLLYAGADRILGVIGTDNVSRCYEADANVPVLGNLGGLALDSVGQMIALEVGTGKVWRIDTRGCLDGNPATVCGVSSVTDIAQFDVNSNTNTRGDAASCISACDAPVINKKDLVLTLCKDSVNQLSIEVQSANTPLSYVWGIADTNATLTDSTSPNPTYIYKENGKSKVYVTVTDSKGCQTSDSMDVTIKTCYICDGIIDIDTTVKVECGNNDSIAYCLPFSASYDAYNYYVNNELVMPERCGYDTVTSYSFITAYTAGYLNNQEHILDSVRINDVLYGPYTYTTLSTLLNIFNSIDPNGAWTSPNDSSLIGGVESNTYGDIFITRTEDNFKHIAFQNSVEIPSGIEFILKDGCSWIVIEDKETLCRDSVQVCLYCDELDTIYVTIVNNYDSTICVKTPTDVTSVQLCDANTTGTYGNWSLTDSCLTYNATTVGEADTICVNACNDNNKCITTTIIVNVIEEDIDTIYKEVIIRDSITECDEISVPTGENLTYSFCDENNTNLGTASFDDGCLKYVAKETKGSDTICVRACSGRTCSTTIVIINVLGNPPVAINDDTISFGNPIEIPIQTNDLTTDGDPISLCGGNNGIITNPVNGTTSISQGNIIYTPNAGFSGVDSLQYAICDVDGADTAWVFIEVEDCTIPNTFSPDGNGKNDTYYIPCAQGREVQLCIYNRWGIEVYKNAKYDNSWDGTYQNELLPDGTYYYVLKYTNNAGNAIDRAGFVVIHRSK